MSSQERPVILAGEESLGRHSLAALVIIFVTVGTIGLLQFLTPLSRMHWLYILQRLYYIPIVVAALYWGRRGGLGIAAMAGVCFLVGTPPIWEVPLVDVMDQCLEVMVFVTVGFVTGISMDWQKKRQNELKETTRQLNAVYKELQTNFDAMKRSERLYALGQLSAGLAHEIRTPLASIEGAAVVIQREHYSEARHSEFLEIIRKECRRVNRLLSEFLDFAKPHQPRLSVVRVDALLDSVLELLRHAKVGGSEFLQKKVQPGLYDLECDPDQLKQVLVNLTMNAIQVTPAGGTVMVVAEQSDSQVAIEIRDQGPGISPENLDNIFNPFFTTQETGTGLGLSIAHQIVTQHGGTLTVSRNSPEGATLRILLPVRQPT